MKHLTQFLSFCLRATNLALVTLAALLLSFSANTFAKTVEFYGDAYAIGSNELLYKEIHRLTLDTDGTPLSETVEYLSPTGETLGFKQLDYQSLTAPNYSASYRYLEESETVSLTSPTITINRGETTLVDKPESLFSIDGGFHYLMLDQFDQLINNKPVRFDFLSAGRGGFIGLKASPEAKNDRVSIKLALDNFMLSKLVKPIELTYDANTRQLLAYKGLTNLPNASGKLYSANIIYRYPIETAQALIAFQTGS